MNALNEAEKHVTSWPVFYIDADVALSEGAIAVIEAGMKEQNLLLAAPEPVIDTSESSWLVKRFYDAWLSLPYIKEGVVATCTFVISEEGRKRLLLSRILSRRRLRASHFTEELATYLALKCLSQHRKRHNNQDQNTGTVGQYGACRPRTGV